MEVNYVEPILAFSPAHTTSFIDLTIGFTFAPKVRTSSLAALVACAARAFKFCQMTVF